MDTIGPTQIDQCFADDIPLLDFQLDDSPTFYNQLDIWSKKVKEGFDIFNSVAEAYKSVCNATSNLNCAWERMIQQLDISSQFISSDDTFAPYSSIIDTMSGQMQEIQRYLKVRVDQMQDLTYSNLKKLADERLKIESLDIQLKKTQENYFIALDKFGCTQSHDKNLVEYGESAMASRRNYYILILKCVFSIRELYSTGIIDYSKSIIQDALIHFTYYTNASNVYKNSEGEIGDFDRQLRQAKVYCKSQIEADEKFHRMLRVEVADKYNSDSASIRKLSLPVQLPPKSNKSEFYQVEPPLEITSPYNVNSTALNKLPPEDGSFLMSEDYEKRVRPLHSFLKTGYLRQRPKGNFALRTPKWPLVYCVIDKDEGWLRAGEMHGDGMYPLQNLMLSTVKKADDVDRIHCFKVVSPELEVTLQAFTPKDYKEWMTGLNEGIRYTLHNNQVVKWKSVKKTRSNRLSIIVTGERPVKQEEAIARIKGVLGNEVCAECGKEDPNWASSNLGVVVCIECSGVHRSLGVHVSKIRSIELDTWTDTLLLFMENKGNIKMNENFEQKLDPALKPKSDSSRKEKDNYITDKYVLLKFS